MSVRMVALLHTNQFKSLKGHPVLDSLSTGFRDSSTMTELCLREKDPQKNAIELQTLHVPASFRAHKLIF